jgi:glycosyltransferase involved in cell wall biosynthesis
VRILHAISSLDHRQGGPAYALAGLARHQQRCGMDVTVFTGTRADDDTALIESMREAAVEVLSVGPGRGPLSRHPDMRRSLEQALTGVDVCHIHALWLQVQHEAARASRVAGVPYVFRPCGTLDPWSLAQSRWRKRLYLAWRLRADLQQAAAIHYTTEQERRLAAPVSLTPPTIVEPNGVDLAEFDALPAPGTFRARFPEIGERPVVLFLSRVHRKKGLDLLIPAFARADTGDAALVIAGPDDRGYLATTRELVSSFGLEADVVFTGILRGQERLAAFVDADFFVLPSYQENFGVAVVEALAAGVPVIISDQVNIHREITAAGVGCVVPTEVEPLAASITAWIADPASRQAAAGRAHAFVRDRYDWQRIAERWLDHYRGILQRRGSRAEVAEVA